MRLELEFFSDDLYPDDFFKFVTYDGIVDRSSNSSI